MTKVLQSSLTLPATISQIYELMTSESFNIQKASITKSRVVNFTKLTTSSETKTTLKREFLREVPVIAQSFIGNEIIAEEDFIWNLEQDRAIIEVRIQKAPLKISGSLNLTENSLKTEIEINLSIKADLPFFSEKIENFAEEIWSKLSQDEMNFLKSHF